MDRYIVIDDIVGFNIAHPHNWLLKWVLGD